VQSCQTGNTGMVGATHLLQPSSTTGRAI